MINNILTVLIIYISMLGCARHKPSSTRTINTTSMIKLEQKTELYKQLLTKYQDEHGFIGTDKCDATLWSGLLGAAYPGEVDLLAAKNGKTWYRRSGQDCGPDFNNSRSTISRDMMLGVFWWLWRNKQTEVAIELLDNLKDNAYIMHGKGSLGELLINPSMLNTLAEMIKALDGPEYEIELSFPVLFSEGKDFVSHLTTWHILLRGEILGSISNRNFGILESLAKREPHNPLYQAAYHKYTDNDMTVAINLLLDRQQWPAGRLPTSSEHCAEWPIQRDQGKDWLPCSEKKPNHEHTGAELLVVFELLLRGTGDANGPSRISP